MALKFYSVATQLASINKLGCSILKSSAASNSVHSASKTTALASCQRLELPESSSATSGVTTMIRLPSAEKAG
jgi:hypothetical protein